LKNSHLSIESESAKRKKKKEKEKKRRKRRNKELALFEPNFHKDTTKSLI